jgi:hypothetical protein
MGLAGPKADFFVPRYNIAPTADGLDHCSVGRREAGAASIEVEVDSVLA